MDKKFIGFIVSKDLSVFRDKSNDIDTDIVEIYAENYEEADKFLGKYCEYMINNDKRTIELVNREIYVAGTPYATTIDRRLIKMLEK
jgi:hypothetical protein